MIVLKIFVYKEVGQQHSQRIFNNNKKRKLLKDDLYGDFLGFGEV